MQPDRKKRGFCLLGWSWAPGRGKRTNKKTKTKGAKKIKKRSVCKKKCETTLWKSAPFRCFYFKKIEDRNFDLLHFCLFRPACWVFCCCFFALCRVPFVHTRLRKTLWISAPLQNAFFCARPNLQQKNLKLSDSLSSLFFLFLCVCCGSPGGRLPRKTLPNRGTLQQSHLVESNQVSIHDAIFKMDFAKDLEFWDMPHRKSSETINLSAKTSMITYHHDWSTKPP